MRRLTRLAAIVAVGALAGQASAQDTGMRMGVIGGLNFSSVSGEDFEDLDDIRTGFDIGVLLQFPLGMVLTFQPELHYSSRGTAGDDLGIEIDGNSVYLDIPLLLRAGTVLGEGMGLSLLAGPYVGIPISCTIEASDGTDTVEDDCNVFDPELELATEFGVVVGGGLMVDLGRASLLVDARYQLGLTDVFTNEDGMNRNIQLLAGFALPVGR